MMHLILTACLLWVGTVLHSATAWAGKTLGLVHAALDGSLSKAPMTTEPLFGLAVPSECPGVPAEILTPRNTWRDKATYDAQAKNLAGMFAKNFNTFADQVSIEVRQAGPQPG